jgi:hypothetical protein
MADADSLQVAMLLGASRALRKRAARQARIAKDGQTHEAGVTSRTGEAIIAARIASVLLRLAVEIEAEAAQ